MLAHLQANLPEEACGVLGGVQGRVLGVYPVENELHSPFAYRMEAKGQIEAMMDIEGRGWDLLAIFHSHPGGPPGPSASDVRQAYYPDSVYVIASPGPGGSLVARAFTIVDSAVAEVEIVVVAE
jgi:proteasome lid subunit RPN8/RPN11